MLSAVKSAGKGEKPMLTKPSLPSPQSSTHGSPANERIAQPAGKRMEKPLVSSTKTGPSSESLKGAGTGLVAGIGRPCGPRAISAGAGMSVSSAAETAGVAADLILLGAVGRLALDPADCVRGLALLTDVFGAV